MILASGEGSGKLIRQYFNHTAIDQRQRILCADIKQAMDDMPPVLWVSARL
jgi:hypothetical protein